MTDAGRLRRVLGDPALGRLLDRLARRIALGRPLTGTLVLAGASDAERRAVARLLGRPPGRGTSVSVPLTTLEAELRYAGLATDLRSGVEAVVGPVAERAVFEAAESAARAELVTAAHECRHAPEPWYESWLAGLVDDGVPTRLLRRGEAHLLRQAVSVLDLLPAGGIPLPVLAERATGDTKALSGTPLASLVLRALAERSRASEQPRSGRRALWESAGVVLDDLASQVLALNVTVREDHPLGRWLGEAATLGIPMRLTLHQLSQFPATPDVPELFVCENPAVLRVASAALGARSAALVCSEGVPAAACDRLVAAAAAAGVPVRWRGDFDWVGVRTTAEAVTRHRAAPWRMRADDYLSGLDGTAVRLHGTPVDTPWDPALGDAMRTHGRAVMEEHLIPQLLADLEQPDTSR